MAKLTTNDITGGYADVAAINENNTLIEVAVENTLSRDGTTPNSMAADLDMDSNDILNANVTNTASLLVAGSSVVAGDTLTVPSAVNVPNVPAGNIAATDVQAAINELDDEKVGIAGTEIVTGDKTLSGTTDITGTTTLSGDTTLSGTTTVSGITTVSNLITLAAGANIAAAATIDLTAATGNSPRITGTTATSAITMNTGQQALVVADGVWPLTYHATTNKLNGGVSYTCAAGDMVLYSKDLSGIVHGFIIKADGTPVTTPIFSESFTSAEQTLTTAGALAIAHGLGVTPSLAQARLICKTAEFGYNIGDELLIQFGHESSATVNGYGMSVIIGATNIDIRYGIRADVFQINHASTGDVALITNGSWKLVLKAWV